MIATRARPATRARVVESEEDLWDLRENWGKLLARCPGATVFSTWEWTSAAWRHLCPGSRMFAIVVEDGPELVGVAPLVIDARWPMRVARFISAGQSSYSIADYGDFVVCQDKEEEVFSLILDELMDRSREWDVLDLHQVPAHSPLLSSWLDEVDRRGLPFQVNLQSICYPIRLPLNWRSYLDGLSRNTASAIERKMRKLAREHDLRFERVEQASTLTAALQALFALHTERWRSRGLPGIFATRALREFHREVASRFLESGLLDLTIMFADDAAIGAIYNFEYRGNVYYYASGFQPAPEWDHYSLGTVLLGQSIKESIVGGMASFDLLRGDGEYKSRFAPRPTITYRLQIARGRAAHTVYSGIRKLHAAKKAVFNWRGAGGRRERKGGLTWPV